MPIVPKPPLDSSTLDGGCDAHDALTTPLLSVIVPVYNEERTVDALLRRVADGPYRGPEKEVLVVDDGSTDGTPELLRAWRDWPGFTLLRHPANRGKGAAVRSGFAVARGEVVLVQDVDLEYDPTDYPRLIEPILNRNADVAYGSRHLQPATPIPWSKFRIAVCLLNALVRVLYG